MPLIPSTRPGVDPLHTARVTYAANLSTGDAFPPLRPTNRVTLIRKNPFGFSGGYETVTALLNPESLRVRLGAEWVKIAVPGLSHEVAQYSRTHSITLQMEFYWDYFEASRQAMSSPTAKDIAGFPRFSPDIFRNFLISTLHAPVPGGSPSLVTVVWPHLLSLTGAFLSVDFEFKRFARSGFPLVYVMQTEFLEVRDRFSEQQVVQSDGFRSGYAGGVQYNAFRHLGMSRNF